MTLLSGNRVVLALLMGVMCVGCGENPTSPVKEAAPAASSSGGNVTATNAAPNMILVLTPLSSPSLVSGNTVEGLAPLKVRFGLCRSDDPDPGDLLSFKWYWGDPGDPPYAPGKPNLEGQTPGGPCYAEHTYAAGRYTATVSASDRHLEDQSGGVGALAQKTQTVNINAYPAPPRCSITSFGAVCAVSNPGAVSSMFCGQQLTWSTSGDVASGAINGVALSASELAAGSKIICGSPFTLVITCSDGSTQQQTTNGCVF